MTNEQPNCSPRKVGFPMFRLRRIAPWIAVLVTVIFVQCYFTTFRDSDFIRNTLGAIRDKIPVKSRTGPLCVLLIAYARTGSSFLGDLIQSFPETFYHFEPLHFIQGPVLNSSFDEARELLRDLFTCNISQIDGFIEWQKQHKNYMKFQRNFRYWNSCNKSKSCFNGTYIDSFCRNQTVRIVKTIRLSLLEATKLFTTFPNLNLKIIYLTRDPRGTMNSRMKRPINTWCRKDILCYSPNYFCDGLRTDVEIACNLVQKSPQDFMVVRYEDISTNPFGVTSDIAKFLEVDSVPDKVHDFLRTHTYFSGSVMRRSKSLGLEVPYSTFRNSSITAMSWRKEMAFKDVFRLQDTCKTFLSAFGYHSYKTVTSVRSNIDKNSDLSSALESTCDMYNS